MNAIEDKWLDYRLGVVPLDAPVIQTVECRRAYYAGAGAVVDLLLRVVDHDDVTWGGGSLEEFRQEVNRFLAEVTAGRA